MPLSSAVLLLSVPRYVDAIKAFNQILLTITKTRQYLEASPQLDQILNRNEQLYSLLAICLALCPNGKLVEESVNGQLREKHADKLQRMQRGDLKVFDELFSFACPKFVTPSPPDFSKPLVNYNQVHLSGGPGRQLWARALRGDQQSCLRLP